MPGSVPFSVSPSPSSCPRCPLRLSPATATLRSLPCPQCPPVAPVGVRQGRMDTNWCGSPPRVCGVPPHGQLCHLGGTGTGLEIEMGRGMGTGTGTGVGNGMATRMGTEMGWRQGWGRGQDGSGNGDREGVGDRDGDRNGAGDGDESGTGTGTGTGVGQGWGQERGRGGSRARRCPGPVFRTRRDEAAPVPVPPRPHCLGAEAEGRERRLPLARRLCGASPGHGPRTGPGTGSGTGPGDAAGAAGRRPALRIR